MSKNLDSTRHGAWNPFRELEAMRRDLERFWDHPFATESKNWLTTPAADFDESPTHYLISVDLPGVNKNEVKVEVHENDIRVFGERKEEKKDASNHVTERFVGRFERRFGFPTPIDTAKVEAAHEDGVLRIVAAKAGGQASRQIRIGESTKDSSTLSKFFGDSKKPKS